ncbi:hypothetical protein G0Q06_03575 [Puniceicoccales bacterium CK1056]|uniref:PBP domain-containing protein n=1 Tax=Oceanipulchritudo coccoides TaxID=2706888 RepID=A0A6B2M021_9BACT|nr:substrate-binding domain-containing protein [Oceanipulchritudo coccoides]NDV61524.1 hypothetical protein [Oceanipulchritudo coccoides]
MKLTQFLATFATTSLLTALPSQALVISGSDLFKGEMESTLLAAFEAAGLDVEIQFDGSLLGQRDLAAGTVDASLLAIPDAGRDANSLRVFPLGYQTVTFLVNSVNPVTEMTYSQLSDLFKEGGELSKWSSFTDAPAWQDRNISLIASRRENALTLELFNALVMQGSSYNVDLRFLSGDNDSLVNAVIADASALALTPAIQIGEQPVKALAIKADEGSQAYTPSRDNIFFGDYPLRLPFYLVVADSMDDSTLSTLLQIIYSDAVTAALAEVDCVPVPEPEQRAVLAQYE